jgi:hypothetical protein
VQEHCETVKDRMPSRNVRQFYGDPHHAFSHTAQSPESIAEQARKCGVHMIPGPSASNSVDIEAQVNQVRHLLINDRLEVFDTMVNTITGFQSWSYKRTPDGALPPGDDRFEDIDDDEMDGVRGFIATNPTFTSPVCQVHSE